MVAVVKDLQAGKPVYTCPHCTTLGKFYQQGVMTDQVKEGESIIVVYTSSDTSIVTQLHDFGKKCADFYATPKMPPVPTGK